jgi:uncharacterized membrane protein YfcA
MPDEIPDVEPPRAHLSLETTEPIAFGHGWISGLLSAVLGIVGLGTVVCFHYPTFLTMPELQPYYDEYLSYIRALLHVFLVASFLLGVISVCLRKNKTLGLVGIICVFIAKRCLAVHVHQSAIRVSVISSLVWTGLY